MPSLWITGAAGFLGARLCSNFGARGWLCTGLSRREAAAMRSLALDLAGPDAVQILRDHAGREGYPEVVIHAASRQPARCDGSDYVRGNVLSTSSILDAVADHPPGLFILISSQSVYGEPAISPVPESAPLGSNQPYGITKAMAERLVSMACPRMKVVILRLPSLFGKGQADSLVDGFARLARESHTIELYNRGETIRDVLHVNEVVLALARIVEQPPDEALTIANLGAGRAYTAWDIATLTVAALGHRCDVVRSEKGVGGYRGFFADVTIARERFGFHPSSLEQSLATYAHELLA